MSLNTRGSAIDTTLAVYSGTDFSTLKQLAADDERGGFHASLTRFNARKDEVYYIAIDGFNGQQGNIVLSWALDTSARDLPEIDFEPESQSGKDDGTGTVAYHVDAVGTALKFQWYFNGYAIPGATSSGLVLSGVRAANVGRYVVRVSNDGGVVESIVADLELGKGNEPVTQDRLQDLFPVAAGAAGSRLAASFAGYPTVSPGTVYHKNFNTAGATTDSNEPVLGDGGGASKWYIINAGGSGQMVADTAGSAIPTLITLHDINDLNNLPELAHGQPQPDGSSRLIYPAATDQAYLFRVDGLSAVEGDVTLNVSIGSAPVIQAQLVDQVIAPGQSASFTATITASPLASYQWYLNGLALNGQNGASLQIANFDPAQAGMYEIEATNPLGGARKTVGHLELARDARFNGPTYAANGSVQLRLEGNTRTYFIDFTLDFHSWTNLFSGAAVNGTLDYTAPPSTNKYQFYRARWQ
jgi:hypothetical protein